MTYVLVLTEKERDSVELMRAVRDVIKEMFKSNTLPDGVIFRPSNNTIFFDMFDLAVSFKRKDDPNIKGYSHKNVKVFDWDSYEEPALLVKDILEDVKNGQRKNSGV